MIGNSILNRARRWYAKIQPMQPRSRIVTINNSRPITDDEGEYIVFINSLSNRYTTTSTGNHIVSSTGNNVIIGA